MLPSRELQFRKCGALSESQTPFGLNEQGARLFRPEDDSICCCACFISVRRVVKTRRAFESHCYLASCHRHPANNHALIKVPPRGMKSVTSAIPSAVKNRVVRTLVS